MMSADQSSAPTEHMAANGAKRRGDEPSDDTMNSGAAALGAAGDAAQHIGAGLEEATDAS